MGYSQPNSRVRSIDASPRCQIDAILRLKAAVWDDEARVGYVRAIRLDLALGIRAIMADGLFCGQAGNGILVRVFRNRPIDSDSDRNRTNFESSKFAFEFRCAPWGRGRATGTCPRSRPVRAHRWNRCGRRQGGGIERQNTIGIRRQPPNRRTRRLFRDDGLYVAGAIGSSSLEEDLIVLRLRPSQSSLLQPIDIKPALCE